MSLPPYSGSAYAYGPAGTGGEGTGPRPGAQGMPTAGGFPPAGAVPGTDHRYDPGAPLSDAPYAANLPQVRSRKVPVSLLVIGALTCLVGAGILLNIMITTATALDSMTRISPGGRTVTALDSGTSYGIYGNGDSACAVTDPAGGNILVEPTAPNSRAQVSGQDLLATFSTTTAGEYTLTCTTQGPEDLYLGTAAAGANGGGVTPSLVACVGLLSLGVPLLLVGLVWTIVRSVGNRKAFRAQIEAGYSGGDGPLPAQRAPQWPVR